MMIITTSPVAEAHHRGTDAVLQRRPEGAVDPALDGNEQPGGYGQWQARDEREAGCVGHWIHLTSGIIARMSNPEIEEIPIRDAMIRLGQLLKLATWWRTAWRPRS